MSIAPRILVEKVFPSATSLNVNRPLSHSRPSRSSVIFSVIWVLPVSEVVFSQQLIPAMSTLEEPKALPSMDLIVSPPGSVAVPAHEKARNPPTGVAAWNRLLVRLSRETTSGRFIPQMDGLRFVAIAMVIIFHLNGYLLANSSLHRSEPSSESDWLAQIAFVGFRGVELFFVISGFILGSPLRGPPPQ